jgi:hypothetical protein
MEMAPLAKRDRNMTVTQHEASATTPDTRSEGEQARLLPPVWIAALGVYLVVLAVVLVTVLVQLWPAIEAIQQAGETGAQDVSLLWGLVDVSLSPDTCFIVLVIVVSALGSYVHAATSFVTYVGNRDLRTSWLWWYFLRTFIGIALALLFYFALRGGFFAQEATATEVNAYGIAALAGLTGLFSKQATDKLKEIFDTLFRTESGQGDDERGDKTTT